MVANPLLGKIWIAFRFIVFGVLGFVVMMSASVTLLTDTSVLGHNRDTLACLGLIVITILGAVMMLYGAGEWGRWGYLFVFLSTPASFVFFLIVPHAGKDAGVTVPVLATVGTYLIVRAYYACRKSQETTQHA